MKDQNGTELEVGMQVVYSKFDPSINVNTEYLKSNTKLESAHIIMIGGGMIGLSDGSTVAASRLLIV